MQLYSAEESIAAKKRYERSKWIPGGVLLPDARSVATASRYDLVYWYRFLTIPRKQRREFFAVIRLIMDRLYRTNPQNPRFEAA